jgi:hypothetical protein
MCVLRVLQLRQVLFMSVLCLGWQSAPVFECLYCIQMLPMNVGSRILAGSDRDVLDALVLH